MATAVVSNQLCVSADLALPGHSSAVELLVSFPISWGCDLSRQSEGTELYVVLHFLS